MEINHALELLELNKDYTKETLRKAYYRKCLQFHPDKNKDGCEMFKLCGEAYETLQKHQNISQEIDEEYTSYKDLFQHFISSVKDKYNLSNSDIYNTLRKIVTNCSSFSFELLNDLEEDTLRELYQLLLKWQHIFHIDAQLLKKISDLIQEKFEKNDTYILEPSLDDLTQHNIYKLMINGSPYYVPLWHNEVYFNNSILVYIKPKLDENIQIDENNNVIVIKKCNINHLLHEKFIPLQIGTIQLQIPVEQLYIRPVQQYKFLKCGIPKINTNDVFEHDKLSDVIVYIILDNNSE